ncbi:MAG: hypothetical protein R3A52_13795 [Polyangiales bacterium]
MGRVAGQFTTTWLALCVMGCGVASPTPDAAADVALYPIDAPRDAAITDDTPETDVVRLPDRPEAPHDAVALDDGPSAGDVDDATTPDVEVVLPAEDAGGAEDVTPDTDVVLPAEDATPDMDVVSLDDAGGGDGDDAGGGDVATDGACDAPDCSPAWARCPGLVIPLDGTPTRVGPVDAPASTPTTTCPGELPYRRAAALTLPLTRTTNLRVRTSGLPSGARVELRRGCDATEPSADACAEGGDVDLTVRARALDAVFRYEGGDGGPLEAEVTLDVGVVSVEARSDCEDGDNAGPSERLASGTRVYPIRSRADGAGFLVVGLYRDAAGAPQSLRVAVRRPTASRAPRYVGQAAPASVVWTEVCDLPGARRLLVDAPRAIATAPLPFATTYFGRAYPAGHAMWLTSTGYASFDALSTEGGFPFVPRGPAISLGDVGDGSSGREGVCVATAGAAPNRRWLVSWPAFVAEPERPGRRQFALHEDGRVDVVFLDEDRHGASAVSFHDLSGAGTRPAVVVNAVNYMTVRYSPVP